MESAKNQVCHIIIYRIFGQKFTHFNSYIHEYSIEFEIHERS